MRELLAVPSLTELGNPRAYLARHSRSFRFAAALLRGTERDRVVHVYAWCRFTDDLVDGAAPGSPNTESRLDEWMALSRAAYEGRASGVALVDRVMGDMAAQSIPFKYAEALGEGMRSDLRFARFEDMADLRGYTYRVAGVVGQWLAELHDVREPWMLDRAAALGHAMQLTNILRDVGEDWDRGRVYLPIAALHGHGVSLPDLSAMRCGELPVTAAYRNLVEELMGQAMRDYEFAREALPGLPPAFRRSVAVAAAVYEGILTAIRRNGYDNFGRRAFTSTSRKMALAAEALWSAARASKVSIAS